MQSYSKLFQELVYSSVWVECNLPTKVVWVTMLALKSPVDQVVRASVPGLAKMAGVSIEECQEALRVFMEPDPMSRSKEYEGRKIVVVDGGWLILNGRKYQRMMSAEDKREMWARNKRDERERKRKKNGGPLGGEGLYVRMAEEKGIKAADEHFDRSQEAGEL